MIRDIRPRNFLGQAADGALGQDGLAALHARANEAGSFFADSMDPWQGHEPGQMLVQFAPGLSPEDQSGLLDSIGGKVVQELRPAAPEEGHGPLLVVDAGADADLGQVLATLSASPGVEFAEPNWTVSVALASNDPAYTGGKQWDMYGDTTAIKNAYGSQAGEAWDAGYAGSMKQVIGIVDTGIDYRHVDLYQNIWLNPKEIPLSFRNLLADTDGDTLITFRDLNNSLNASYVTDINGNGRIDAGDLLNDARWENGIDDDGNGYKDDLVGWDFVNNDNDPFDDNGHGTHVAGTIGGTGGNGSGIAGENWSVQMMGLKFLSSSGSGSLSAAVQALDYFTAMAAATPTENFVATNNSWGGGGFSQALSDAITRAAKQDILFIAAAGNGGSDGIGDNNDSVANYPSNYNTSSTAGYDAVVAVASLTSTGALSSFSNYGKVTVDLAAPGSSIYSTLPGDTYGTYSGTSMATPHVTGAAALYASTHPDATAAQIKAALLGSAAATTSVASLTVTGGRLDIGTMMGYTAPTTPPPSSGPNYIYGTNGSDALTGTAGVDIISGLASSTTTSLGKGTVDRLTGLGGNDTFILGDARGAFYNDGNGSNAGKADYALILDFQSGDKIQLSSKISAYFLAYTSLSSTVSGVGIYADTNGSKTFDSRDELVGLVSGSPSLSASDFIFA